MPARIIAVSRDDAALEEAWVEKPLVRVGSDAQCDIRFRGLPEHAVTVRFHAGQYQVINRTDANIVVGRGQMKPDESSVWNSGDRVSLPGMIGLVLEVEPHDPAPRAAPAPRAESVVQPYTAPPPAAAEEGIFDDLHQRPMDQGPSAADGTKSKQSLQLAVIGLCFAMSLGLVVWKSRKTDDAAEDQSVISLAEVVHAAEQLTAPAGRRVAPVIDLLQRARLAEVRGQAEQAEQRYLMARDRFDEIVADDGSAESSDSQADRPYQATIQRYIRQKLAQDP